MKNSLDFNIHTSNYLESSNFIQRFASAFMFLEVTKNPAEIFYEPDIGGKCFGCGSGGEKHSCKKDKIAEKRCGFFFLFNTMCGNSAIRRRFDGTPTEIQKLTGEYGQNCGSDFTVDFLFGYTGYEYRIITELAMFKDEVIASIDAGKPVISRNKSGAFQLITGYDGDTLIVPSFVSYWDPSTLTNGTEKWEEAPIYYELDALYIFGDKTTRRYTLKDGLNNICRVMEYNASEGLWDEYLDKIGRLDKASSDEKKSCAYNLFKTNVYMYNFCSFGGAFDCEKLPEHYLHKELFSPSLTKIWSKIDDTCWAIVDAGHKTGKLGREQVWLIRETAELSALSAEICEEIVKAKEADIKTLEIINQAIEILEKNQD